MNILSIGNSFSMDAQRYIHRISELNGNPIKAVNLYIGGCSLRTHFFNMLENNKKYEFQFNGEGTRLPVTIKDALMSDEWDFVTFQQASFYSPKMESYEPYLSELSAYVKKYAPQAKQLIHQTWAYSDVHVEKTGVTDTRENMFNSLFECYNNAKKIIGADGLIPTGKLVERLIINGIDTPYRDGYHLSLGVGRLAAGLLWYCFFTGANPDELILPTPDEYVSEEESDIIRKSVKETLNK
jgi:hypothetical protein